MKRSWLFVPLLGLCSCHLCSCKALLPEPQPVTPQRPTVSSDTSTTAKGTWELEAGLVVDPGDRVEVQSNFKWGIEDRTELFLGVSPYQHIDRTGGDVEGTSDLSIGLRHRFLDATDERPGVALQTVVRLPTANRSKGLGSGEADVFPALIASKAVGSLTATAYYQLGLIGRPAGTGTDIEHTFALALGAAIDERLAWFGEFAGQRSRDLRTETFFTTLGLAFTQDPTRVFDGAVVIGLDADAPDFQILFGLTTNLGHPGMAFDR